jgi:hypothetical protein
MPPLRIVEKYGNLWEICRKAAGNGKEPDGGKRPALVLSHALGL